MLYDVTAVSIAVETGEVLAKRTERIHTRTNPIFESCTGPWDIEDRYEAYWNRLNQSWEHHWPTGKSKVKVLSVVRAEYEAGVDVADERARRAGR